ncbi:hypothetical protein HI113_45380, partial [Corallococcus exiguus]|uniref:hypothetical protein n=1 Tax=Corallococcus exiguus TaxID=83462 RepID=UPI00181F221F|nr:hypothetical protein [Corallococcus exiguus]
IDLAAAPLAAGSEYVLTAQAETLTGGAGDDTFIAHRWHVDDDELYGGDGNDTLRLIDGGQIRVMDLKALVSIETITGSVADDIIYTLATQLTDVRRIDGGGGNDRLAIYGPTVDLTGKTITGFASIYVSERS